MVGMSEPKKTLILITSLLNKADIWKLNSYVKNIRVIFN